MRASSGETLRHLALAGNGIGAFVGSMTFTDRESGALMPLLEHEREHVSQPLYAVILPPPHAFGMHRGVYRFFGAASGENAGGIVRRLDAGVIKTKGRLKVFQTA